MDTKRILQVIANAAAHFELLNAQPDEAIRQPEVQKALADLYGKQTGEVVKLNTRVHQSLLIVPNPEIWDAVTNP